MRLAFFAKHLMWSVQNADGSRTEYDYYDRYTVIVLALVLAWMTWFFVRQYIRARAMRRKPRRQNQKKTLRRVVKLKNELSSRFLRKGVSKKIHAVGVGKLAGGEHCIQIFINDSDEKMFENSPSEPIPNPYKNVPVVLISMPQASFLSEENVFGHFSADEYRKVIRDRQEVMMGGISGANTNLTNQYGTIGYFCRRKSLLPRRSEVYLLSNSHVFVDLKKGTVDEHDLIMQPSPGESASNRAVGELAFFSPIKLENDTDEANFVDAALAKLWREQPHRLMIPMIGAVKGFVQCKDVEVGETARKFGRTTGFTSGKVFSVYLDIRLKYDRTGQNAFFKNQILITPDKPDYEKFVDKGDSGSLLVDAENYASGLIFAGANSSEAFKTKLSETDENARLTAEIDVVEKIEHCGVANPMSDVLSRMKMELML
jgi:hypothetical protein